MVQGIARQVASVILMRSISVLAFAAIVSVLTASVAFAGSLKTGVSGVIESDEPIALQHVKEASVSYVYISLGWGGVAPRSEPTKWNPSDPAEPNYDWRSVDVRVANAVGVGLTPVILIDGGPRWAQRCKTPDHAVVPICDPDPAAFAAFVTAAAHRYSGYFGGLPRVRYWQGLNEPNLSLFFNPQIEGNRPVSPSLYRKLINAFYFAVKSVHPSNMVLSAGLGPIARPPWTIGPMRFTRELLCMRGRRNPKPTRSNCEGGVHFDIFDIHPYTTGGPTHKGKVDDVQLGDLEKLQELLTAADRAGRIKGRFKRTPLWITEFSWDSRPPDPGGVPMRILTRWTSEALYRSWSAGVSHFFWFSLRDSEPNTNRPFSESLESGLYFRGETIAEDRPKPNMYAFRFPFVAYSQKDGFSFWGRTPNSKRGLVRIQIRQGGSWRNAERVRADRHGIFEGVVRGGYGRKKRGAVRAVYRRERSVPFSLKPVRDFWQPPFGKPVAGS